MSRTIKQTVLVTVSALLLYILFFPLPTPELSIRRDMLITSPLTALTGELIEGKIKNDPMYGDLYIIPEVELCFVYVKKNILGWYVTSRGTGP
jgi:hypothetical protein